MRSHGFQAPALALAVLVSAGACGGDGTDGEADGGMDDGAEVRARIDELGREAGAELGVWYHALGSGRTLGVNPDLRMHAASTMKVPVLLQLFLDAEAGRLSLDDSVEVTAGFRSIVDGSRYELDPASDSDSTLYRRVGQPAAFRELAERMITRSSNLATNLLVERLGADRITETLRGLGADSIEVLRGVEDLPAYEAGLSNTTTARDLGIVLAALAGGEAASPSSRAAMLEILERQEFRAKIPAGLPSGTRVANKTGWITSASHDAAIVFPGEGDPYVLVVLTRGIGEPDRAERLIADVSRTIWQHHTGG